MTTKLIQKSKIENNNLKLIVKKLANESPELKDLNKEQLEQIAKIVITQRLTNEMNERANIENINYKVEKDIFLMTTSKIGSQYTKSAYRDALLEYEKFCRRNNINIFMVNYAQADDFIYSLEGSPNSKRLKIAAISSFYSYIHRRYSVVKNPIRGTKARPTSKKVTELEIPDDVDMMMIMNNLPEIEKTAVCIMAYRGLRIGALNKLKVWGTKYQSVSKGKAITGELPIEVLTNLKSNMLNYKSPFEGFSTNALKLRIYRATTKLHNEGKIKSAYSAHDFRHYFAISEYKKDKDIYKLCKLLDHSNIAITENYLKGLKFDI